MQLLLAPMLALPGHEQLARALEPGQEYVLFGQTYVRLYPPPGQYELSTQSEHGFAWPVLASPEKPALHRHWPSWVELFWFVVELGGQDAQDVERTETE